MCVPTCMVTLLLSLSTTLLVTMTYNHHSACLVKCYEIEVQRICTHAHTHTHTHTHRGHTCAPDVINCLFMFPVVTYNHIKMYHGHNCTNILLYQNSTMHIITYKVLITLLKIYTNTFITTQPFWVLILSQIPGISSWSNKVQKLYLGIPANFMGSSVTVKHQTNGLLLRNL